VSELPAGTVTFLFTDIEGSTRLLDELGAERFRKALGEHRRVLREAFARHRGYEVDYEGDAFFVAFQDAAAGVTAAREAQEALAGGPMLVRMGLHTGEPLLDPPKYVGRDVHLAARIMSAGHGGQVVLSQATVQLVEAETTDLGEHRLKDFDEPVWLFQLGEQSFAPLKTISNTNLPRPASSFVGREREVAEIVSLVREGARLVTLTGPGGSGKTRLAIEAAAELVPEFKAGVFWVGLSALRDPALVLETIAQTLGARQGLAEHIGGRELLLLLDNVEQVVEAASDLADLVESCPKLTLVVTSRELLRVRGEVEYAVLPLADQDAVELFCARSGLAASAALGELCRRLDDLPLALELAAARAKALSPEEILARLGQRLDLFKGGRDADPRQQTLRATMEWSHDLLTEEEQHLFARLSVFAGGCTLDAAETVCDADLDTLQSLVEKSLLRHTGDRFWMLETIREYSLGRLEHTREAETCRNRHVSWFLALAEEADLASHGSSREPWFDRLEADHGNLRVVLAGALQTGEAELELRVASALWRFWAARGYISEGRRWLEAGLKQVAEKPLEARLGRCYLGQLTGDNGAELLVEAEMIAAACKGEHDRFVRVQAESLIGLLNLALGRSAAAEPLLEDAVALAGGDYPAEKAEAIGWLLIATLYGPFPADQGIARCEAAYERAAGNRTVQAFALVERAALESMQGQFDAARKSLSDGRSIFRELDLKVFAANTAQEAYFVEMLADNPLGAIDDLRSAYELLTEMGERGFLSTIAGYLAHAYYEHGDLGGADHYATFSAEAAAEDDWISQCLWRSARAKVIAARGGFDRALEHAAEAIELIGHTDWINTRADRLTDLADVLRMAGRPDEAADALRQALRLYEEKGNLVGVERIRGALSR
jgi:predicted ATPase